ncbi:MAG: chalcone isomerase family protein [Planctomycetota bacterium]
MKHPLTLLAICCVFASLLVGDEEEMIQEPESEVSFRLKVPSLSEEGKTLGITGLGCREKTWVNVYAIAHFASYEGMKDKLSSWKGKSKEDLAVDLKFYEELCKANIEKRFVLILLRDIEGTKIESAFREGLTQSYTDGKLSENAEKLLKVLANGVKEKDKLIFRYMPGGKLLFSVNKDEYSYEDETLAQAIWRIYFCETPTVGTSLRDSLISEIARVWK